MKKSRVTSVTFEQATYSPREAEQITGAAMSRVRDWRRRHHLRSFGGEHARFDGVALGHIYALMQFSEAGIGQKIASDAAKLAASQIWDHVAAETDRLSDRSGYPSATSGTAAHRYVIIAGGRVMRADSLRVVEQLDDPLVIIFDCAAAAKLLMERAPRPLLTVVVEQREAEAA